METRLLRYFLAAAREENITRAAESLHISQPSLSKQLMELENELGKKLFIRGKRKLTLTSDGILLRRRAEEITALLDRTERELRCGAEGISGEVYIGGSPTPAVLRAAAALRTEHPGLRFDFYSSDATDVTERLDHGSLDFAVLLEPVDSAKYDFISLGDHCRWGLLMPDDCPLAAGDGVSPEQLGSVPLIFHRRAGIQRRIALWAQTEPERMNVAATYNVINGSPSSFIQSGLGYLLTGEDHIAANLAPGLCFRPLDPPLTVRHALVWKRYAIFSRPAEAFLEALKRELA